MKKLINQVKRKTMNKAYKIADRITAACAPYEVRCTYGTRQAAWTIKGALEWVAMCEDVVVVVHRATGHMVATRDAVLAYS
jgi:heme A synthase